MTGQKRTVSPVPGLFSVKAILWLAAFCLLLAAVIDQTREDLLTPNLWSLIPGLAGLCGLLELIALYWRFRLERPSLQGSETLTNESLLWLMVAVGFALRLWYVLYTPVNVRQHDVFSFGKLEPMTEFVKYRHAEYIEYICRYLKLPQVDPTAVGLSQLYHPPLHHLLAGLWLRLQTALGSEYTRAVESIQLLTLFYSSACMLLCGRLFRQLGLSGKPLLLAMSIICFHPTFVLLGGSVNNDILSVMLGLAALVCTIRWYWSPSIRTILPVALTVGASMMTKLSGGLLAPGIAVVFLWRAGKDFLADNKRWRPYFYQFALFAVVCVPLALWWQTRNFILYDTPLAYVPGMSANSSQYIGTYTLWQRLFGMPVESLTNVFEAWKNHGAVYNEYSIPLALFKTAVFDESTFFSSGVSGIQTTGLVASFMLFYSQIALAVWATIAMGIAVFKRRWLKNTPLTAMLVVIWCTLMASFVLFCFRYAHTCTQNFRYLVPTLAIGAAFLGQFYGQTEDRPGQGVRIARYSLATLTGLFCISAAVVYTLLGCVNG